MNMTANSLSEPQVLKYNIYKSLPGRVIPTMRIIHSESKYKPLTYEY